MHLNNSLSQLSSLSSPRSKQSGRKTTCSKEGSTKDLKCSEGAEANLVTTGQDHREKNLLVICRPDLRVSIRVLGVSISRTMIGI